MRHMKYRIHGKLIASFLEQSNPLAFEVTQGLPQGIKVIDIIWNPSKEWGVIVLEHESFADVSLRDVPYLPDDIVQYSTLAPTEAKVEEPEEKSVIIKPGEEQLH